MELKQVNNDIYRTIGEKWYNAEDDPVALLRAESKVRTKWVVETIKNYYPGKFPKVLDVGCGGGFLTNVLIKNNFDVTGIDLHVEALEIAKLYDTTHKVRYLQGDAYVLPFENASFDVLCIMDVLEHVERVEDIIKECSRVLKPGGLIFFHTFNRNFLSYLIVIKGVEWFVKNTPPNMHVYHLFIKPKELVKMLSKFNFVKKDLHGVMPKIFSKSFFKMLFTGKVDRNFKFVNTSSLTCGYSGYAQKSNM